jgi:site-specific recombinase XerD
MNYLRERIFSSRFVMKSMVIIMNSDLLYGAPPVIREFLVYMETIKGKSPATVAEYFIDLRTFFRFIKKAKGLMPKDSVFEEIPVDDVDIKLAGSVSLSDIYEYLYFIMHERQNNASTRSRKISSLRSFYKYHCEKTGALKENPTRNLETPKKKRSLPKYLTLEESMGFLNSVGGPTATRDYCIMTLFLNCGLRLSELVGLNISDISENKLTVTGKGNKERTVYLNKACIDAIDAYINIRPNEGLKDKNALFISRLNSRISPKTVQWIVKKDLEAAGLSGKGYSTHKLRHTAATLMYQHGGVDIRVLQELLGHENLNTTEIYTHTSSKQLKEAAVKNPLSGFRKKAKDKSEV